MAFSDPQSVTIDAAAVSLPRTSSGLSSGVFSKDDGTVTLSIQHAVKKRVRRTVRIDHRKVVPDPLFPATNAPRSMSVYIVVDAPVTGYSNLEQQHLVEALTGYLSASSGAHITQLLGGES